MIFVYLFLIALVLSYVSFIREYIRWYRLHERLRAERARRPMMPEK